MSAWLRQNAAVLAVGVAAIGLMLNQQSEFRELSDRLGRLETKVDALAELVAENRVAIEANRAAIEVNRVAIADIQARLPTLASTEENKPHR